MNERATSAAIEAVPDAVALPSHIEMREHMGALEITLRQSALRRPVAVLGAALAAFLGGFSMAIGSRPVDGPAVPALAAIAGVPVIVYGYFAAVAFFNTTTMTVTRGHLRFVVGPVPFFAAKDIAANDIAQLTSKMEPQGWSIYWRNREGAEAKLLGGLRDESQAKQVERLIEERLGIVDELPAGAEPVPWTAESRARANVAAVDERNVEVAEASEVVRSPR